MTSKHHFQKPIAILIVICAILTLLPVQAFAASAEWTVSSDDTAIYWVSTADSRADDEALKQQVQLFAQELEAKGLGSPDVKFGPLANAGSSDIVLYLSSSLTDIPEQGYKVEVGNAVKISASDADGLFYGCRYVLQHLITKSDLTVGKTYTDSPDVLERGVSLDCGRKYWTKDWIIYLIREMSWYNMNALTLHFSEDMGIRLEHPNTEYSWIMGSDNSLSSQNGISHTYAKGNTIVTETYQCNDADEGKYLTIAELKEIVTYANLYHVEIIPSFDSPGHMTYLIEKYKDKYGVDIGAWIYSNGEKSQPTDNNPAGTSYSIDLSNQTAIDFTRDVIKGYAELFRELGCTKFDMGGDELLGSNARWKESYLPTWAEYAREKTGNADATPYDAFMLYINDLADMLYDLDYESVRMWNDQAYLDNYASWTVPLDTRIEINYWKKNTNYASATDYNTVNTYLDKGHNVYNYYNDYNYYVVKPNGVYPMMSWDNIYNYWTPYVFETAYTQTTTGYTFNSNTIVVADEAKKQQVKGSAFCIWCDCPDFKTQDEVIAETINSIRAHAIKAWGVDTDTIDTTAIANTVTALGLCPGTYGSYGVVALGTAPEVTAVVDYSALYEALDATLDESLYTTDSVATYKEKKAAAEALLSAESLTQTQVDSAVAAMNDALVLRGDPTGLQAAVNEYSAYTPSDYTAASFQRYSDAVTAGKEILERDSSNVSVAEYADAENAVKDARNALVSVSALNSAIAAYEETSSDNYTYASFAQYTEAVNAARALLEDGQDPTQAEVDAAAAAIETARANLALSDGACEILGSGFRTNRVRIGGKAVIWLTMSNEPKTYQIKDSSGEVVEYELLSFAQAEASGTVIRYLKFTVSEGSTGSRTYTVTVDGGAQVTHTLRAWREK